MTNRTTKFRLAFLAALVLLTSASYTVLLFSINSAYGQLTVDFNFDAGSPPPLLYQSTPFSYQSLSGVTAHFSSPMDPAAYSIQNQGTTYYILSTFSGNYLWPSGSFRSRVEIKFSQPLTNITFSFATMEFHGGPTGNPSFINLTTYLDSTATTPIGKTSAQGNWPGEGGIPAGDTYPQGVLTFSSAQPFNLATIVLPYQGSNAASSFLVDNIVVITADTSGDAVPPVTTVSLTGTLGNLGWYKSDVVVSLSATDDMSGVNRIEYSYDNAIWNNYVTPFSITTEGTTIVYYRAADNAGNVETAKTQEVKIDKVPPASTASFNGVVGNGGWYRSDVTVTLSASDGVSGVAETKFSFDNIAWMPYSTPFTITADGTTAVYYQSTDNAGNIEAVKSQTLKIDKVPPTTTINLNGVLGTNGWYTSSVTVTFTASDSISGVANTEYSLDGTSWLGYTAPFSINNEGTNLVYFRSTDVAGNIETPNTQTVKVDTSSPVTTITLSGVPGDVTITLSTADTGSGISKTEYSFDNTNWVDYTAPFHVTNPALTTVYYRSMDMAGNLETVKTKALTGDNTPPVTVIGLNGFLGTQGWYTSNVEISLSATDDWSGVAKTEFSLSGIAWTTYTHSFTITNEGATTLYYRSTDVIGNIEETLLQTVEIDKTAPTGSIVINGDAASTTSASVTLTLTSNDAFSGVSEVRYSNDGTWDTETWEAPSTTKTWTLTPGLGAKTVYYQIKDNAGLISATYQDNIILETLLPGADTIKPVANAGPDRAATEDTIVMLDGSASTDNVAVTTYTWMFIDVTTKTLTGIKPTYTFATPGNYTITLNATDAAGNWATDTLTIEILDTTSPIANAGQDRTANIGEPISFDASASTDNVGIVSYEWNCGDGTTHTGKTITHTYNASGTYIVTLTVYDAAGNTANHSIIATVSPAQTPSIQTYQLWIILTVVAVGIGATAALLRKRK